MSTTTIQIPAGHVEAVRQSLLGRRDDAERQDEVDGLLAQIGPVGPGGTQARELTGSRTVLWSAVYDSLCAAAEQLAEDCNEYWRGEIAPDAVRAAIAGTGARLELLVALGPAPDG
jgi:hypothetical protein